jgi:ABC-type transporter Mla subunit MlaD
MIKRILGFFILIIGIVGIGLSVGGALVTRQIVDQIGKGLDTTLGLTSDTLGTMGETLDLTKKTVQQANDGLDTVSETAVSLSETIADTQPLLEQVSTVTTEDIPDSIEAVQGTIPNMAEVAGAIDTTLVTLSAFQVEQSRLGFPLRFDLGIDYQPEEPFDETIQALGDSLDGMPESLRALEVNLAVTSENLGVISENIISIAGDLETINGSIEEVEPLLDDYIRLVNDTNDLIGQVRSDISEQLEMAKIVATIFFAWIGLYQIAPLYLGWEMVRGDRDDDDDEQIEAAREAIEALQEEVESVREELDEDKPKE